ncbi:hypothetical protein JTB14_018763 [Gonioctena quinquepunctata]|nr:hypothetical protein JTB14_018763 [Gonioctena quinquepunctata]
MCGFIWTKGRYQHQVPFLLLILMSVAVSGHYRGLYTDKLLHAHETIPRKVTAKGDHISHHLTTFHKADPTDRVHFNLSIGEEHHILIVQPARHLFIPALVVEKRKRHNHTRTSPTHKSRNCHFQGVIDGQRNSRVAISACNGLTGVIISKNEKYYIEPAHHPKKIVAPGHKHLVFKRSAVITSYPKKRRKKRRKPQTNCGTRVSKKLTMLEWQTMKGKVKVQRKKTNHSRNIVAIPSVHASKLKTMKYKRNKGKRSISVDNFVETLVVADAGMVEFHQDGEIETYILTLMNMVSMLFQDPSIGNSVHIVVVKIILIEDPFSEPILNITTNADLTLKTFCKWQLALNPPKDNDPHHHDAAILITRRDICARQNSPCGTLGVAHIGGMCKASRSCSVNEDNGITSSHTIAHELGHK